jgi:PilX N-terminal
MRMTISPQQPKRRSRPPGLRSNQRGAATLVVVMVLFFIVALVAAYTSRNLIFEQRTSANQYRSTQALEAAEAGLEWALAMLNSGRIDTACQPYSDPAAADAAGHNSFRQRYLQDIDADGRLDGRTVAGQPLRPACVFDGTNWQCSCPVNAAPSLAEPAGTGPFPAFVLRFSRNDPVYPPGSGAYPAGVIRIESTGCTRVDTDEGCAATAASGDGRATVTILAALKSALSTPPTAAVTVRGNLTQTGTAQLRAVNSRDGAGGSTVHSGQQILDPPWLIPVSAPGTPGNKSFIENDRLLHELSDPGMFATAFGMARDTYRLQPATVMVVDCAIPINCSADTVRGLALLNPNRILWIEGDFDLSIADPIGTAALPVTMVVNGSLSISNAGARLNGVVYLVGDTLTNNGALTLTGALVAQGDLRLAGNGTTTVVHDAPMLNLLNRSSGSFVRVPGSWRDF